MRACVPAPSNPPFGLSDADAQAQRLIEVAVALQGDSVEFLPAPWVRCLAGMHEGRYDLIVGVEPDPDFYPFIAFPQKAGKIDASRRLGTVEYVVVQKATSGAAWDSKAAYHLSLPLVVPRSISAVTRRLEKLGVDANGINYDPDRFVSMLLLGRAGAVVLKKDETTLALSRSSFPGLSAVQEFPFVATDVYLGIRRSLLVARPQYIESIWREVGRLRSSLPWPSKIDESITRKR